MLSQPSSAGWKWCRNIWKQQDITPLGHFLPIDRLQDVHLYHHHSGAAEQANSQTDRMIGKYVGGMFDLDLGVSSPRKLDLCRSLPKQSETLRTAYFYHLQGIDEHITWHITV